MTGENAENGSTSFIHTLVNPRRKRFWFLILLVVYTIAGFGIAPRIAKQQIVTQLGAILDRPVSLGELRINPYALSVDAQDFRIDEADGTTLVEFSRLYINVELWSLVRRALMFDEIRLEQPFIKIVRDESGSVNLARLVESNPSTAAKPIADDTSAPLPRIIIGNLVVAGGTIAVSDNVPATDFSTRVGPITVEVSGLSTLEGDSARQQVAITSEGGTRFEWDGSLQINPFSSTGSVTASGKYLPVIYRYFQDLLNFSITSGEVDLSLQYRISAPPEGGLDARVSNLDFRLFDCRAVTADDEELISIPEIHVTGGFLTWPDQDVGAKQMLIREPNVSIRRHEDRTFNVENLIKPVTESEEPEIDRSTDDALAWDIRLAEIRITDLATTYDDDSLIEPGRVAAAANLTVTDISTEPNAIFPFRFDMDAGGAGKIEANGTIGALPSVRAKLDVTLAGLELEILQPWINDMTQVVIEDGIANARADATFNERAELNVTGSANFARLEVRDTLENQQLIGWRDLVFDRIRFDGPAARLEFSDIRLVEPSLRLRIAKDGTTNVQALIREKPEAPDPSVATADSNHDDTLEVVVGRIRIVDGAADFSDLALPIPFNVRVSNLDGEVSTLSTASNAPAKINFDGQVGKYGLATIEGSLLPRDVTESMDLRASFRNVPFPDLTPYTIKFAGQEIDGGRLEVDLNYRIDQSQLAATNSVIIQDIKLGEKTEHPDAMDLPLGLAVALLKDPDGHINISVPVKGNLDDPDFSIGGVILRAFANLIIKAATSPFRLLGGLVGIDSDELDTIEFNPGNAALMPPEQEKIAQLADALAQRPNLSLSVPPDFNAAADTLAISDQRVDEQIDAKLGSPDPSRSAEMLAARRREVLESLYRDAFSRESLRAVRAESTVPLDAGNPAGSTRFDDVVYANRLRKALVESQEIAPNELEELSNRRANAIIDALTTAEQPLARERVEIVKGSEVEPNQRGHIPVQLKLSSP